jgi:hypothetical protein
MTPSQVDKANEQIVRARLYPEKPKRFKYKFNIGDTVRMSNRRNVFHKSYSGNCSEEIFTVCSRHPTQPVTYSVKDAADQPAKGRFYECKIQSHKTCRRLLRCRKNTEDALATANTTLSGVIILIRATRGNMIFEISNNSFPRISVSFNKL